MTLLPPRIGPLVRAGTGWVRAKALPARWLWLDGLHRAWLITTLLLILGVLTLAAVRELSIECRREPSRLLTTEKGDCLALEEGGGCLLIEEKRLRCRWGLLEILPAWVLERL
jgi:hypothetical protein